MELQHYYPNYRFCFYQSAIISILTYLRNEVSIKTREAKVKLPAFTNAKFIRRSN